MRGKVYFSFEVRCTGKFRIKGKQNYSHSLHIILRENYGLGYAQIRN
jgi:hypothetical protein